MKPRLLLVADTYYPKVDGTLRFMEEFMRRAENDFELHLLVPDLHSRRGKNITFVKPSRFFAVSGYPSMKLSWRNVRKIRQAVREADLIFVQGPALISYAAVWLGHRYHKTTFFYTHTIAWELFEKFMPPLVKTLFFQVMKRISIHFYNLCDGLLLPYHGLQEQLREQGVRVPVAVAQLGVDIDVFSPAMDKRLMKHNMGLEQDRIVIGYVGRISKEKNIDLLLDAFERLPDQHRLQLLLVGDGPPDQVKKCRELNNCVVTGFVSNVQDYLRAMDIFVMPSLTETTSLATLEAMSCGLPVLVTRVGFMKNYVAKGYNGLFIPRNSSATLALKIEQLRSDRQLRETLGKNARKTVAYSFSWERSISRIKKLLLKEYYGE